MLLWITAAYGLPPAKTCHDCITVEEACKAARREVHIKWIRGLALAAVAGLVLARALVHQ